MKKIIFFAVAVFFLITINLVWSENKALLKVIERIAKKRIVVLAKEPIVVSAVKEANKEATKSSDEIIRLDKRWRATEGVDGWIGGFLNTPCSNYLRKIQTEAIEGKRSLYSEIFIMDKQGCIVAETDKTSDYWQGDEDKFVKSFVDGKGSIFIDEPQFDDSTQKYLIQVSVPILDPYTKKAIGAMTVGLDLDLLVEQSLW